MLGKGFELLVVSLDELMRKHYVSDDEDDVSGQFDLLFGFDQSKQVDKNLLWYYILGVFFELLAFFHQGRTEANRSAPGLN